MTMGRHSYLVRSIFTERYSLREAPPWLLPTLLTWVSAGALIRGIDLGLDPSTDNEVFAYANILGANTWGWIQAVASGSVLLMMTTRWAVGVLAAQLLSIIAWLAYAIVVLQAVMGVLTAEGGLRNAIVPLVTAGLYVITFVASTQLLRQRAARDGSEP